MVLNNGPFSSLSEIDHTDLFGSTGRVETGGGQGLGLGPHHQGQGLAGFSHPGPGLACKGEGLGGNESLALHFGRVVMFHGMTGVAIEKKDVNKSTSGKTGGMGGFSFWGSGGGERGGRVRGWNSDGYAVDT